jgi:hypothetical protein
VLLRRARDDLDVARPRLLTDRDDPAHGGVWTEQEKATAAEFEVGRDIQEDMYAADLDELELRKVDVEIASVAEAIFQLTVQDRPSVDIETAIQPQSGRVSALSIRQTAWPKRPPLDGVCPSHRSRCVPDLRLNRLTESAST